MMQEHGLALQEERLLALRERMVRAIGIHTLNVLLERAIWEASRTHPELAFLERTEDGLSFAALEQACAGKSEQEVSDAFNELTEALLLILARLLGKDMAQRLAEDLSTGPMAARTTQAPTAHDHRSISALRPAEPPAEGNA